MPVKVMLAPPDSFSVAATVTVPELTFRLIACPLAPSLSARSPLTVNTCAPALMVWVALLVHEPARLAMVWSDPPEPSVKVIACALPNEMLLAIAAETMAG